MDINELFNIFLIENNYVAKRPLAAKNIYKIESKTKWNEIKSHQMNRSQTDIRTYILQMNIAIFKNFFKNIKEWPHH